jgi:uncharacterized tellurite resistance protein B-like protein
MINLYNATTNELLGSISENELSALIDNLEEESQEDQDYYINAATIEMLANGQATEHLLHLLRTALGDREGVEVRWQHQSAT